MRSRHSASAEFKVLHFNYRYYLNDLTYREDPPKKKRKRKTGNFFDSKANKKNNKRKNSKKNARKNQQQKEEAQKPSRNPFLRTL